MDLQQTASQIGQSMARLGVHLRQDWIMHCLQGDPSIGGSGRQPTPQSEAQEAVYRTFLACDLREAGEACLPAGVARMVKERMRGKVVVQVENAREIAKSFEQREKTDAGSSFHTLKMAVGDGRQTVAAFEYRRIEGLNADPPPGLKLLLVEPWVRRGILLLSSDNTTVLGGEVASLVEARDKDRERNAAGADASSTGPGQRQQGHGQPGDATGIRTAVSDNNNAVRSDPAGNTSSRAVTDRDAARSSLMNVNVGALPPRPTPGENSQAGRRRRRDESESTDRGSVVVDLSSSSEEGARATLSSRSLTTNDNDGCSAAGRGGRGGSSAGTGSGGRTGPVASSRRPSGQSGSGSGVFNPYTSTTQRPSPGAGAAGTPVPNERERPLKRSNNPYSASTQSTVSAGVESMGDGRPQGKGLRSSGGATRNTSSDGEPRRRAHRGQARVPAFQGMDDEEEPEFEYLEEPDFDDDTDVASSSRSEQQPPDDFPLDRGGGGGGGGGGKSNQGMRNSPPQTSLSNKGASVSPPPPDIISMVEDPPPRVTPRPKIVSARAQHYESRDREEGRRRLALGKGRVGGGGSCSVVDIEEAVGHRFPAREKSRERFELLPKKRSHSTNDQPEDRGNGGLERSPDLPALPSTGPFTYLENMDRLSAAGKTLHRVKAVVSDMKGCKIRKKKYLLMVEIEDGTAVVHVRLSEQITRRLFGVEAREFKKIFQANPDQAMAIQARVEKEIREMEGVMEVDTSATAVASGSQQSSSGTETPGVVMGSQGSATGDSEWLLPVVTSVKPPTDGDCRELLSRVRSLIR